jgi:hypothetical protein
MAASFTGHGKVTEFFSNRCDGRLRLQMKYLGIWGPACRVQHVGKLRRLSNILGDERGAD